MRIPIPWKGQLGFFDVDLPKTKTKNKEIVSEIMNSQGMFAPVGFDIDSNQLVFDVAPNTTAISSVGSVAPSTAVFSLSISL